jgi:hypothetical protein
MTVLFMEGFTGIPRAATPFMAHTPLNSMGWTTNGRQGGTGTIGADTNVTGVIEADTVFADRNQVSFNKAPITFSSYFLQAVMPLDTSGYEKFVIGGMFMATTTMTTAANVYLCIGDQTLWTSSTASFPLSNIFVQLAVPNDGSNGTVMTGAGGSQLVTPLLKKDKWTHFEIFLEQDADRVRVYLDGTLVLDATWTGTFAGTSSGLGLVALRNASSNGTDMNKFSNLYVLGVDSIHTGPVGPAARVLEIAPPSDFAVEFTRPSSFASNAAVLAQMYNADTSNYLTAGLPATDLYGGINAVAANAAQVFGAAVKVRAMSMADGTHTISAAAKSGSTDWVGAKTYTLTIGALKPFVMDVSRNPATNAAWTPSQIAAAGIGFRLVQ